MVIQLAGNCVWLRCYVLLWAMGHSQRVAVNMGLVPSSQRVAVNTGFSAHPWAAAGGDDSAHLVHRGAQPPSDLHVVVVHQKGCDVLPVVALRHLDSGDGGKPCLLRSRETGFSPMAPGDPSTQPGQSITEGGVSSLASKAAQAYLQLPRQCPHTVPTLVVVGLTCTHLLLNKELQPHVKQPLAQLGAVGLVSLPRALQTLRAEKTEKVSAADRHLLAPTVPPRALVPLTSSASMAKPSLRLKKLLMGAVWWYLQNPRDTQRGSAWLQHSSPLLLVGETEAQHSPSSSPSAELWPEARVVGRQGLSPEGQAALSQDKGWVGRGSKALSL